MAQVDFNAEGIEPMAPFTPIPPGRYGLVVTETDVKATKKGDGSFLLVVAEVDGGEHAERKVFLRFNIDNPNKTAEDIGKRELAALMGAVGISNLGDSDELIGATFDADIIIDKNKDTGQEGNRVKAYYESEGKPTKTTSARAGQTTGKKPENAPGAGAQARKPWQKAAA